ncbi:LOB domain-containing protein 36-like [Mangifera indica]|uniref:LOB domain-containing protein 36-like n=1 Tax=Mangifera indica TaxID=29780 RepID=UPI001CFA722C|nr:LOB domain-containing protein 36-like [Mangifera indica]
MSSSNSPCAACKFQRRKCAQECIFAPYFPPDQPQKYANVHNVFGASNVAKLLNELSANLREDAANSLVYEAEARLRDPVYGCVGLISILQHRLKQIQSDLYNAKKELASYIGPQAMMPMLQPQAFMPQQHSCEMIQQHGISPMMAIPMGSQQQHQNHQQQQMLEAQQMVAEREQQILSCSEQQQQQDVVRFNCGFDDPTATGFHHMSPAAMSPLALGSFDNPYQIQPQQPDYHLYSHPIQAQILLQSQRAQSQPHQQAAKT